MEADLLLGNMSALARTLVRWISAGETSDATIEMDLSTFKDEICYPLVFLKRLIRGIVDLCDEKEVKSYASKGRIYSTKR